MTLSFINDNRGIELTEVALIIAVVVLVAYGAYKLLGQNIAAAVTDIAGGTIHKRFCRHWNSVSKRSQSGRTILVLEDDEVIKKTIMEWNYWKQPSPPQLQLWS